MTANTQTPLPSVASTAAVPPRVFNVIGTDLLATDYESLVDDLIASWRKGEPRTLSFCNTYMVARRRHIPAYREVCAVCDTSLPDGMPLIWCMNSQGAGMMDRVYGPIFMERFIRRSPREIRHYFLGGDVECLRRLCENAQQLNPDLQLVGSQHGFLSEKDDPVLLAEIDACEPDFIWIGMGTPKQDEWAARNRAHFSKAILLPVGSSFEILAGVKGIPPMFFQKLGLTWFFRMCSEPGRLIPRYVKWNSLFLFYLLRDLLLGTPTRRSGATTSSS